MEDKVLAVVSGRAIKESDLQEAVLRFPRERQSYLLGEEGRKQLLEQLISMELFSDYAKESGIEQDELYIDRLEKLKKEVLTQVAINKVIAQVVVTDDEVAAYYEANKDMFRTEETVNAKHILVEDLEKANEVLGMLKEGMAFEEAAQLYSSCPSKAQGGDLGSFGRGRMVPEFEKAAFELEIGKISAPVKTQFGYHLIKVEGKEESSIRPLEEVFNIIKKELLEERQSFRYMEFTEELKKKYNVEIK